MIVEGLKKAIETDKSLSRGTLRNYDLITCFLDIIDETPEYMQMLASPGSPLHPACGRIDNESDECCLELYKGDKKQMEEDLSHFMEDCSDYYYTFWESYVYS